MIHLYFTATLVIGLGTAILLTSAEAGASSLNNKGLPSVSPASGSASTRVIWMVSEYRVGKGAVWGEEEARALLFKPLDMSANTITFDGNQCGGVVYNKEKVNMKEYLDHAFHTTPQALGIDDVSAELVKTNCSLPGFSEYLRLKDRRIVTCINGVFFYFRPAVHY